MTEDKGIKDAIDSYIKLLEKEQKSERLAEERSKENASDNLEAGGLEKIKRILKKSIELICLGEEVKINTNSEDMMLSVQGRDLEIAIGREGRNIQALEYIINQISRRRRLSERKVTIDIKDYRKNRIEKIKKIAAAMAKKAINEGRKIALRPMCSYERKIIHKMLEKFNDVTTRSRYEEPNRRIIIYPVKYGK